MTLLQFFSLWDRWVDREDRENYRTGVIASFIANSTPNTRRRKAAQPRDIMPSLREQLREQQYNSLEDQVAALKHIWGSDVFTTEAPKD